MAEEVKRQSVQLGGERAEALVRIGTDIATRHIDAMHLPTHRSSYMVYDDAEEAYQMGYREGSKVDIHGARSSRMLAGG